MKDARNNQATEAQAYEALRIAQIAADLTDKPMKSSALSCAKDAAAFFDRGMFGYAHAWACESLRYSVGILHPDFARAKKGA
jgi:hypothetical protein